MNIWLIKEGEEMPFEGKIRLMRMGALAKYLSNKGHKIVWWSSTFKHATKELLYESQREVVINSCEKIILLHSPKTYKKNISLQRILYQNRLAKEFLKKSGEMDNPDIILCAWPNPQFAKVAIKYGKEHRVPVVIDVRDQWPDIFEPAIPKILLPIGKIALSWLKMGAHNSFSNANGITGMSLDDFRFGCNYAGRDPGEDDKLIFIGTDRPDIDEEHSIQREKLKHKIGLQSDAWNMCFFSTLSSKNIDLETVIKAVISLDQEGYDIHLYIGGEGDDRARLEKCANKSKKIHFLGWLNKFEMDTIMNESKAGVYCMRNTPDFINTFSNKAIQYLSAGLPIINSLSGFAKDFISDNGIGLTYKENDVENCKKNILYLYMNDQICKEMSKNAVAKFEKMFSNEIVNSEFENYLKMIYEKYKR